MSWVFMSFAIVFEVLGTTMMKLADGFSNFWPSVGVAVFYAAALGFLTLALKQIELSIAYAIWSGVGTAMTVVIGIAIFDEPAGVIKFLCIAMIIAGVVGLQLISKA